MRVFRKQHLEYHQKKLRTSGVHRAISQVCVHYTKSKWKCKFAIPSKTQVNIGMMQTSYLSFARRTEGVGQTMLQCFQWGLQCQKIYQNHCPSKNLNFGINSKIACKRRQNAWGMYVQVGDFWIFNHVSSSGEPPRTSDNFSFPQIACSYVLML